MNDWMELVRSLVTWLLVIFGWLVVADQQDARELAKHINVQIIALRDHLAAIEERGLEHHRNGFDEFKVQELVQALGDFSSEIAFLATCGFVGPGVTTDVIELRRALTARNMDASSYAPQTAESPLIREIANTRSALDRDLMSSAHRALTRPRTLRTSIANALQQRF